MFPSGNLNAFFSLQCRIDMAGVPADTAYDVLHDNDYRKKWDLNAIETHDIARLAENADVGYYSCEWLFIYR